MSVQDIRFSNLRIESDLGFNLRIEARDVSERPVLFEDGELPRIVNDPKFHANVWDGM